MSLLEQLLSKKPEFDLNSQYGCLKYYMKGAFSDIFTGKDLKSGEEIIIKAPHKTSHSYLEISKEAIFLSKLQKYDGFPKIYFLQANSQCEAIAIEKLGLSMQDLKQEFQNFSLKTTIILALQLLRAIEKMHSLGILHRDIKPSNILSGGPGKESKLYLIDFDIATSLDPNTAMKSTSVIDRFLGTKIFASRNAHQCKAFSKKDDLESLLFTLIYLHKGSLPWEFIECDIREMGEIKNRVLKTTSYLKDLPTAFGAFFTYLEKMENSDLPNYEFLENIFVNMAKILKIDLEKQTYEWNSDNQEKETTENSSEILYDVSEYAPESDDEFSIGNKMDSLEKFKSQNIEKFIVHMNKKMKIPEHL